MHDTIRSISVGILINPTMKKKFKLIDGKPLVKRIVGVTCETCAVKDCLERAAPPIVLERKKRHENTDAVVQQFMNQYS